MPHDLPKAYDPTAIEDHWAAYWVREKLFVQPTPAAGERLDGKSFVILLPPPNVTGRLHMGHMLNQTEMDILTRWRRMSGDRALWLPGTDHAGIATQMMVERQLAAEGTSRQQLGREAFEARVWEWKCHYGGAILEQMKRLGVSVDWSREYFTMDERLSVAVREAFVRLYHQGLIYRGAYIVNWCPRCQTAISDLEVEHVEQKGHLWEIRYPILRPAGGGPSEEFITVATTRPETMLGDTAVAVHPDDERYKHLHGKKLRLPLMNREIPVITDEWVSREFGTGAVKVTPAHDPNDFALGERHHLPKINVMDETAHINAEGGAYAGLDRFAARKRIVHDLEAQGLLAGVKDHINNVGHCDRCKTVVEPRLSMQWFVKIQPLADRAIEAVEKGYIRFTPENYKKIYLNWMANIYDWCISRQLWWGHRIPAWHCAVCGRITVPEPGTTGDPRECEHCGSGEITQETDVLDTWFSSGLLPVSVFGWPRIITGAGAPSYPSRGEARAEDRVGSEDRADFDAFYPTTLLVTGFDILFFWVARMIMLGCWFAPDIKMPDGSDRLLAEAVPFREVYIHALVRDANREKMSKTKGNVLDPIEIVSKYGTDAVRFTLASMASPGTDIAFNVARTEGYRAFANKIWNAARFIFMNVDKAAEAGIPSIMDRFRRPYSSEEISAIRSSLKDIPQRAAEGIKRLLELPSDSKGLFGLPLIGSEAIEDRWIVTLLYRTAGEVNKALEEYRFDEAANTVYQFFWGSFCDWYLEIAKLRLDFGPALNMQEFSHREPTEEEDKILERRSIACRSLVPLLLVFESSLRMLSPFMPFISEELWHAVWEGNPPRKSIALAIFPKPYQISEAVPEVIEQMALLQSVITEVRALRKESGVEEKAEISIELKIGADSRSLIEENRDIIERLARVSEVRLVDQISAGLPRHHTPAFDVAVVYERTIDVAAERERHTKDIAKYEKQLASGERDLANPSFVASAPAHVVEGRKKMVAETRVLLEKARAALRALPPE
ncbi:MAG TPA: valine--tRNA ligase [Terracidiphilus sp.]|nr:valine--tRNA ligase [Terracidiphilus sp.]